jgi:hypothetical protein
MLTLSYVWVADFSIRYVVRQRRTRGFRDTSRDGSSFPWTTGVLHLSFSRSHAIPRLVSMSWSRSFGGSRWSGSCVPRERGRTSTNDRFRVERSTTEIVGVHESRAFPFRWVECLEDTLVLEFVTRWTRKGTPSNFLVTGLNRVALIKGQ